MPPLRIPPWHDKERSMSEDVKAHITGVVFQVTTKPGDAVAAGDPVIVLESMKMEIPVEAPRAGTRSRPSSGASSAGSEADLARPVAYKNTLGQEFRVALGPLLQHVVNHATHHRSEAATMITMISGSPPDTGINTYRTAVVKG